MGEESRVQVASLQMPHLLKSDRFHVLHVRSVTASSTVWRTAQVSRRRLSKTEKCLFKKQEYVSYVSFVSATTTCQEDVETGRCAITCSMPHPTVLHDESKISPKHDSENEARVLQSAEETSSCTSTCNANGTTNTITNSMIVLV